MARLPVNPPYTITTAFGVPDDNARFGKHSGIDYAVPLDRPIYAPTSGDLTNILSPTGGKMVVIFDGTYYHRLMHNNSFSRAEGKVSEGDIVAQAGTTGLSTGVHCHWDVNDEAIYPKSFAPFIDPNVWLQGGSMPTTEEILQSALNAERNTNEILQSALNDARSKSDIFESALNVERDKNAQLEEELGKEGTKLTPGKYVV